MGFFGSLGFLGLAQAAARGKFIGSFLDMKCLQNWALVASSVQGVFF